MKLSRAVKSMLVGVVLVAASLVVMPAAANADVVCNPGGDICQVTNTVNTPAGVVSVVVSAGRVVTVQLTPIAKTLVLGSPFEIPPGPPLLPNYSRATFDTGTAGIVNIDTVVVPPGPPARFSLPNVAVISIHPPSPCRVRTVGNTVTFTPIS